MSLFAPGCPAELQNAAVDAIETATRDLANTALDLYFEQYRNDQFR